MVIPFQLISQTSFSLSTGILQESFKEKIFIECLLNAQHYFSTEGNSKDDDE
jgi:hypothetical protein